MPAADPPSFLRDLDYSVVQQCMHCGMCLPTCPTYAETLHERNSPRGRIALMRAVADGELEATAAFGEEMYYCLGCLACMTACPADVDYAHLVEMARAEAETSGRLDRPARRFWRWLTLRHLFMKPRLLRLAGRLLYLYQATGLQSGVRRLGLTRLLPRGLRELEPLAPTVERHFSDRRIAPVERPAGAARHRVVLLTGCVQDLVFASVNRDTADVLLANGCEVVTPRNQHCCGSLHAHNGEIALAQQVARRQIDGVDPADCDAIVTNAAGCGSHLKHYDRLLADDPVYATRAAAWSAKVRDVHEWLAEIGVKAPPPPDPAAIPRPGEGEATPVAVAYHEACHLCHGQGITAQPRALLDAVPGLRRVELEEATWCCGSAGVYNITQPEQAAKLLARKVDRIERSGAAAVATGNPGCLLQIANGVRARGLAVEVVHPVTLLARAYRGEAPGTAPGDGDAPCVEPGSRGARPPAG